MSLRPLWVWFVLLGLIPGSLTAEPRELRGKVVRVGEHHELIPEVNITVTIEQTGNSGATNSQGIFRIPLPEVFKAGEKVTLVVDKPEWRILDPLGGVALIPADLRKDQVEVHLAPVGSKLFLSHAHIENLFEDLVEKSKEQVRPEGKPEETDFGRYIKDWATQYGLNAQQAREEIEAWIADIEQHHEDEHKRGLAAVAKKQFAQASRHFNASAERTIKELEALQEKTKTLRQKAVRDLRLEGDAHYNNYAFAEALQAYQRALTYLSKEEFPQLWAATFIEIGIANEAIGTRTHGHAIHRYLRAARTAYRQALEVYTRAQLPQQWATTQNNLGVALRAQGIRTGGSEGTRLLGEAVAAYRQALQEFTREQLPQDWAMTQNNLGIVLQEQGIRTGGSEGTRLLGEAVAAYRQALQVRTREQLPQDWAMTQNNLGVALRHQGRQVGGEEGVRLLKEAVAAYQRALEVRTLETLPPQWVQTYSNLVEAYADLEDWSQVAASYANVLKAYPDYKEAYQRLGYLYHEVLFQFPQALTLNRTWLERYPDDLSALIEFAEKHFTTENFAECERRIVSLLENPDVESGSQIALRILEVANLLALGQPELVAVKFEHLIERISAQPEDFKVRWTFHGAKQFINQHDALASYREWLQQVFEAVEGEDRAAILAGLRRAQSAFRVAEQ